MVRAGLSRISLIDGEVLGSGNICRHVATLSDVGEYKVIALAGRLQQISPHVEVFTHPKSLPTSGPEMEALLEPYDLVVDCTASDDVLQQLAQGWWSIPRLFVSFSLGFKAERFYSFGISGHQFPNQEFNDLLKPWLDEEALRWGEAEEAFEGAGCWSPLFPARYDDVLMAASFCIKELERMITDLPQGPHLRVFEQARSGAEVRSFTLVKEARGREQ
jgi:hypothetical protein